MRTVPKALATFRDIVESKGEQLRKLKFEDLNALRTAPTEHLTVDSRPSTISIIVLPRPDGSLQIVVQGFMNARFLPMVKHVALDGFYKHPDETVTPMDDKEFYAFD